MKKTLFTALRAMCVGAMTLFAVSCYDDSALWSEIEDLDARLTALEEKLNTEVATLNSKLGALETAYEKADSALLASVQKLTSDLDALDGTVDGYVKSNDEALKAAIEEYKKADETLAAVDTDILAALATMGVAKVEKNAAGNVVITFVDESTVEVGAADANANNTGLVTVVDGKWAVVGADGKTTVLDAELHPDTKLAFKVNADNNELYVSYDDGATWEPTGVIVKDATTINVVTAFKDGEDFVTLTVGGVEYQLPKYVADNSSLVMGRTDVFFGYGVTKTVELNAEEVTECYVMTKPDGWKATLDGTTLTVTAPAEELVKIGAGELKGQVLVHANTTNGACKVVELDVTTGPSLTLSYEDGNITVFNAMNHTYKHMGWIEVTEFYEPHFGISKLEDFMAYDNFADFIEDHYQEDLLDKFDYYYSILLELGDTYYEEGVREEQNMSVPLSAILDESNIELDDEQVYIFWIVPVKIQSKSEPDFGAAQYVLQKPYAKLESSNATFSDVDLSIDLMGADGYYIGAVNKSQLPFYEGVSEDELFKSYILNGAYGMGGPLMEFMYGSDSAMGEFYKAANHLDIKLSDAVLPDPNTAEKLVDASSTYYVWILPYFENKDRELYIPDDVIYFNATTGDMKYSSEVKATVGEIKSEFFSVSVDVTPPKNGTTYYKFFDASTLENDYTDGDVLLGDLVIDEILLYRENVTENSTLTHDYEVEPCTDYKLALYSTTSDGYYGDLQIIDCPTASYEFLPEGTVELKSLTLNPGVDGAAGTYTAIFKVSGADKIAGYSRKNDPTDFMTEYYIGQFKGSILKGLTSNSYQYADVTDGEVTLTIPVSVATDYFVYAYSVLDGTISAMLKEPYIFNFAENLPQE